MTEIAIGVVGQDRVGVVADVTRIVDGLGLRLTDSTMTLIRGQFAITLICAWPPGRDREPAVVRAALAPLAADGSMTVTVTPLPPEPPVAGTLPYTLTVHGTYHPGTVAALAAVLGRLGINVTDLVSRLSGTFYLVTAEVEVGGEVDLEDVSEQLDELGARLRVEVNLRPGEADVL